MKTLLLAMFSLMIVSTALAQEAGNPPPPPGDEGAGVQDRNGPGGRDLPPPPRPGERGPGGFGGGRGQGGPDGFGPPDGGRGPRDMRPGGGPGMGGPQGGPPMGDRIRQVEVMRGYMELVDRYTRLAENSSASGIAAVVTAGDILKKRGNDAAVDFYTKLLPEVKDPAVKRAIQLQLADLYKATDQGDKAIEQLRALITGAEPAASAPKASP